MSLETRLTAAFQQIGTDVGGIKSKTDHISVTQAVDLDAIETRVNALDQAVVLKGTFSASGGSFPGSGSAQAGEAWISTSAGTIDGMEININDRVIAVSDNASVSDSDDWHLADYTDEVVSVNGRSGSVTGLQEASDVGDTDRNFLNDYTTARDA